MSAFRRVAMAASVLGWVYAWKTLTADVRGDIRGPVPTDFLFVMTATVVALMATTVTAGSRMRSWRWIAPVAGLAFVVFVVAAQLTVMNQVATSPVPLSIAIGETLRARSPLGVVVVSLVPTLLLLSGLSALIVRPRQRLAE